MLCSHTKSPNISERRPRMKISSSDRLKMPSTAATGTAATISDININRIKRGMTKRGFPQ